MHFEPTDRFDNACCVRVCGSVKDQSIPDHYSSNLSSLCISLHSQILNQSLISD